MADIVIYCDHCGAANRPRASYCFACGQQLPATTTPTPQSHKSTSPALAALSPTGRLPADHPLLGRYRILRCVGQGGMGAVYEAEDTRDGGRRVAVKEMSQAGLGLDELVEATDAFEREAELLASLDHLALPRIHDHFRADGRWYLVMDFIPGETLEERLRQVGGRGLQVGAVVDIGLKLCDVLAYLHGRTPPVIFRDLKPANVMMQPDGRLALIDFGIARHFKPGQSADTVALGSPGYAAPEQYGKAQTDARSDLYALGATLHQMLTGSDPARTPFVFAPIRGCSPAVPAELDGLVLRLVQVEAAKRPADVEAVSTVLGRVQLRSPITATSPGRTTTDGRPSGGARRPGLPASHSSPTAARQILPSPAEADPAVVVFDYGDAPSQEASGLVGVHPRLPPSAQCGIAGCTDKGSDKARLLNGRAICEYHSGVLSLGYCAEFGCDNRRMPGLTTCQQHAANGCALGTLLPLASERATPDPKIPVVAHGGPQGRLASGLADGTLAVPPSAQCGIAGCTDRGTVHGRLLNGRAICARHTSDLNRGLCTDLTCLNPHEPGLTTCSVHAAKGSALVTLVTGAGRAPVHEPAQPPRIAPSPLWTARVRWHRATNAYQCPRCKWDLSISAARAPECPDCHVPLTWPGLLRAPYGP